MLGGWGTLLVGLWVRVQTERVQGVGYLGWVTREMERQGLFCPLSSPSTSSIYLFPCLSVSLDIKCGLDRNVAKKN